MPYSSNSELPAKVKTLPDDVQNVFRRVFNSAYDNHKDESRAFATAWTAVENGWKKKGDNWVKKDDAILEGTSVDRRRARTFSQVIADVSRGLDAGAAAAGTGHIGEMGGAPGASTAATDWRGHYGAPNVQKFIKADSINEDLGMVFGWAIVSTENGEPYFDVQGDHIPEDAMLKAASDFMENSRVAKDMHTGDQVGSYLFCWPMTADIAKAMGIECTKTGLMIGYRPPPDILAKFKSGEYTGFSIGGVRLEDEEVK
jgi:cation transport regulator ChaB